MHINIGSFSHTAMIRKSVGTIVRGKQKFTGYLVLIRIAFLSGKNKWFYKS